MNILEEIAEKTRSRVAACKEKKSLAEIQREALSLSGDTGYPFEKAVRSGNISFICEVKKASPSKGLIAEEFPVTEIARDYEAGGASAISVLTEPYYFQGSDDYLRQVKQAVSIPVLRKDFTVDEYMIYEAKVLGADAVLLICAILNDSRLKQFLELAHRLGLSALVEAHDEQEIERAKRAGARLIGVNNRDLRTFTVDINNSIRYRKQVPSDITFVSESGIQTRDDIIRLEENQVNGVLIGETLMRAADRVEALRRLMTGTRVKICGLKRQEDVEYVNETLPDYVGFVFAPSKRQVTMEQAERLAVMLDPAIRRVGVFVNQPVEQIVELLQREIIQYVQLHGEEDNAYIAALREKCSHAGISVTVIKAVQVKQAEDIRQAQEFQSEYLLLDAWSEEGAGGNGKTFDWNLIRETEKPFFLAGGLNADNVCCAIRRVHPYGVDASSSLETDGRKDQKKISDFIAGVRSGNRK